MHRPPTHSSNCRKVLKQSGGGCKVAGRTGDVWAVEAKNTPKINNQTKNKPLQTVLLALKDEPPTSASLLRAEDHTVPSHLS